MAKDVHEQSPVRFQPTGDPPEQFGVVAHMFEHLHRDHTVEGIVDGEFVHVGGDDPHVDETLLAADRLNKLTLWV